MKFSATTAACDGIVLVSISRFNSTAKHPIAPHPNETTVYISRKYPLVYVESNANRQNVVRRFQSIPIKQLVIQIEGECVPMFLESLKESADCIFNTPVEEHSDPAYPRTTTETGVSVCSPCQWHRSTMHCPFTSGI
jgi:hypothetical protein